MSGFGAVFDEMIAIDKETGLPKNGRYEEPNSVRYYRDGLLHREDGPAEDRMWNGGGLKVWWQNGLEHRTDGPAVIYALDGEY